MEKKTRKTINYINNKSLYTAMLEYKTKLINAENQGKPKPQVSDYVGKSIMQICNNLSSKGNFAGYPFREEMVDDGIIDCIAAVDNFDPDRYQNPFAYFTQIAWYAFIRRIDKEKKQMYIKHKNFQNMYLMDGQWSENENMQLTSNDYSDDIIRNFENNLTKAKKKSKDKGVEVFANTEVEDTE